MKNRIVIPALKVLLFLVLVVILVGCTAKKTTKRSYKQYEKKTIQFDQKKYKFHKDYPPVQRYYNKSSIFRPKK